MVDTTKNIKRTPAVPQDIPLFDAEGEALNSFELAMDTYLARNEERDDVKVTKVLAEALASNPANLQEQLAYLGQRLELGRSNTYVKDAAAILGLQAKIEDAQENGQQALKVKETYGYGFFGDNRSDLDQYASRAWRAQCNLAVSAAMGEDKRKIRTEIIVEMQHALKGNDFDIAQAKTTLEQKASQLSGDDHQVVVKYAAAALGKLDEMRNAALAASEPEATTPAAEAPAPAAEAPTPAAEATAPAAETETETETEAPAAQASPQVAACQGEVYGFACVDKQVQLALQSCGYSTGAKNDRYYKQNPEAATADKLDGARGPLTNAAIASFKRDFGKKYNLTEQSEDASVLAAILAQGERNRQLHKEIADVRTALGKAGAQLSDADKTNLLPELRQAQNLAKDGVVSKANAADITGVLNELGAHGVNIANGDEPLAPVASALQKNARGQQASVG